MDKSAFDDFDKGAQPAKRRPPPEVGSDWSGNA